MALTNICILKYNNYFNRIVKQPSLIVDGDSSYNSLSQYQSEAGVYYETQANFNFYKNDNINTEIIFNTYKDGVDYLIEYDSTLTGKILSRWFIIENQQMRAGQSKLTLRRDLMVDYKDNYIDAPAFIEKGFISPTDVAIYNQEDISFNQIKKSETLLKDKSNCSWIIGYVAANANTLSVSTPSNGYRIYGTYKSKDSFKTSIGMTNNIWQIPIIDEFQFRAVIKHGLISLPYDYKFKENGSFKSLDQHLLDNYVADFNGINNFQDDFFFLEDVVNNCILSYKTSILEKLILSSSNYHSESPLNGSNDILVFISNENKYYKIHISEGTQTTVTNNFGYNTDVWNVINNALNNNYSNYSQDSTGSYSIGITSKVRNFSITFTEVNLGSYHASIPTSSNKLIDSPYKMFAIPVGEFNDNTTHRTFNMDKNISLAIASQFALDSNVYDVQLLPYCPFIEMYDGITWRTDDYTENSDYSYITDGGSPAVKKGIILFPKNASFEINIQYSITNPDDAVSKKKINQCDTYRIVSPNFASMFEFNPIKTGNISSMLVSCTYKPYSPYIHIKPNWSNDSLYGFNDKADSRGLIFQGDFSLPIINDQWQQYQLNNKNYLNSFNRQIESIELSNKYQKTSDIINAITGSFVGGAAGAFVGSTKGGIPGAVIGAVGGAVASGIGGGLDVNINDKLRRESINLQIDQFKYNLQNIQALPYTLSKISSFDINNRIYPVIEYYTCTDQEKEIFENKLLYNGMTIMRIDKLSNFVIGNGKYFKGQFIRLEDVSENYKLANSIADEFYKGVFI